MQPSPNPAVRWFGAAWAASAAVKVGVLALVVYLVESRGFGL